MLTYEEEEESFAFRFLVPEALRMLPYADVCGRMLTYADVCRGGGELCFPIPHARGATYAAVC
jgi:hypothetical protein